MKHFADVAPMTRSARMKLFKKDPSCFLLPPMHGEMPKYPICDKKGKKLCQGVLSAKMRADLVKNTYGKYSNRKARKTARRVRRKAIRIARDHGCEKIDSMFKKHKKKHKRKNKFRLNRKEVELGKEYILKSVPEESEYDNWRLYVRSRDGLKVRVDAIEKYGQYVKLVPTDKHVTIRSGANLRFPTSYLRKRKVGMW